VKPDIGYTAPDFTLEEAGTGQSLSLSQFRGQPVIVIFWVTWCPYCAKSLPLIQAAYDRHRAEGLVVLAVDAQESEKKVRKAAQNMGLTFNLLLDSRGKVQNLYDVIAYPWTFFIDRNGVIHGEHRGSVSQQVLDQNLPGILK
jgi:peroxiredoxin